MAVCRRRLCNKEINAVVQKEIPLIEKYRLTVHARFETGRRGIKEVGVVRSGQVVVYRSRFEHGEDDRVYLLRMFVAVDREPAGVVMESDEDKAEVIPDYNALGNLVSPEIFDAWRQELFEGVV